jgi:DnaJ-class molecular chaperone
MRKVMAILGKKNKIPNMTRCNACKGTGKVKVNRNWEGIREEVCWECSGKGQIIVKRKRR